MPCKSRHSMQDHPIKSDRPHGHQGALTSSCRRRYRVWREYNIVLGWLRTLTVPNDAKLTVLLGNIAIVCLIFSLEMIEVHLLLLLPAQLFSSGIYL